MPSEENVAATETDELRRLFHQALKALSKEGLQPSSPCPDSEAMVAYVTGTASDDVRKDINGHLARCDTCWDDYVALVGPERIAELVRNAIAEERVSLPITAQHAKEKWSQLVARAKEFVIDLGRTYGPGALIGSVKVLAEGPALAVRGAAAQTYALSKLIEVPVEDNVYGIEISESKEGMLFDVAGYKTSRLAPLAIAIALESGEELIATKTDKHGNARFILPRDRLGAGELLLTFTLADEIREALFLRISEKPGH